MISARTVNGVKTLYADANTAPPVMIAVKRKGIQALDCSQVKNCESLDVSGNPLTSLKGAPENVETLVAEECGLESLDCPQLTSHIFSINGCANLRSLRGGPKRVASHYSATRCDLHELECEDVVLGGKFLVSTNPNLRSLRGGPKYAVHVHASNCNLLELDYRGATIAESLFITVNPGLRSLLGAPRCRSLICDAIPVLGALGRAEQVVIRRMVGAATTELPVEGGGTLFRTKLELVTTGEKAVARIRTDVP